MTLLTKRKIICKKQKRFLKDKKFFLQNSKYFLHNIVLTKKIHPKRSQNSYYQKHLIQKQNHPTKYKIRSFKMQNIS